MDLRDKLKHGDMVRIAELAGVHPSTVEKTIHRGRNNAKVKQAAKLLIESREAIKNQMNK